MLVLASDHGFAKTERAFAPSVLLAQAGLAERVWFLSAAGAAFFYLKDTNDRAAEGELRRVLTEFAADPSHGVAQVLGPTEIAALHGDPQAVLAIEMTPGFAVVKRDEKELLVPNPGGTHGYTPERPEMRATLIFFGPRVPPTTLLRPGLVDVAPTVAAWLGLSLPSADGKVLPISLR